RLYLAVDIAGSLSSGQAHLAAIVIGRPVVHGHDVYHTDWCVMAGGAGQNVYSRLNQARGQDRPSQGDVEARVGGDESDQRLISQIDRVHAIGPDRTIDGAAFDVEVKHDRRRAVGAVLVDYGLICSLELRRRATRRVGCQFRPKRSAERDYYVSSRAAHALD